MWDLSHTYSNNDKARIIVMLQVDRILGLSVFITSHISFIVWYILTKTRSICVMITCCLSGCVLHQFISVTTGGYA